MGELLWDLFPDRSLLGGSGANVAFHAAQLGAEAHLISRVGRDELGARAMRQLERAGVKTSQVSIDPHKRTGTVHVTMEDGEPRFQIGQHVAWDCVDPGPDGLALTKTADAVCYGTLVQRTPMLRGRVRKLLQALQETGSSAPLGGAGGRRPICILDINLRPPYLDLETIFEAIALADVIKLNEEELEWIGKVVGSERPTEYLLDHFKVRLIAETRGARGAKLTGHHVEVDAAGVPVSGGDPVGAGDSFVAALSIGLALGRSPPEILEETNRYAAWVASQHGAMPA